MIFEAKSVSSLDYAGYNYNIDNNSSITSYTSDEKEYKKATDVLYFFTNIKEKYTDKYLLSFYANNAISKIKL